jgi:hypothetical protein
MNNIQYFSRKRLLAVAVSIACGSSMPVYAITGFSEVTGTPFSGVTDSSVAWGDYDNDGDLDLILSGADSNENLVTKLYQNTGGSFSEVYAGMFTDLVGTAIAWGDYDNDDRLDLFLAGATGDINSTYVAKLYRNTGSGFSEVYPGTFTPAILGDAAWGDYDNDGDLDLVFTGYTGNDARVSKLYRNTGNGFSEVYAGTFPGVMSGGVAWGDYDNDGRLDLLLGGGSGYGGSAVHLYRNTGSGFTLTREFLPMSSGSAAWGDYDNDGDLDVLLTGNADNMMLYENTGTDWPVTCATTIRTTWAVQSCTKTPCPQRPRTMNAAASIPYSPTAALKPATSPAGSPRILLYHTKRWP